MNRAELLAAMAVAQEKPRPIDVPGLGRVFIKSMTVEEYEIVNSTEQEPIGGDVRSLSRGLCRILSDEQGDRVLREDNPEDMALLAKLPRKVMTEILTANAQLVGEADAKKD